MTVVRELDQFLAPGSEAVLFAADEAKLASTAERIGDLGRLHLETRCGPTTDRATLAALDVTSFNHVIVMSDDEIPAQRSDARTLVTLLHLRELTADAPRHVTIASEMLDAGNRALAQVTKVDDVIVSDEIVSLLLAQISENEHLAEVFDELFNAEGSEVYLRDASTYVTPGEPVTFATLVASAAARGESAIGYRHIEQSEDPDAGFGVRLNVAKSATAGLRARRSPRRARRGLTPRRVRGDPGCVPWATHADPVPQ